MLGPRPLAELPPEWQPRAATGVMSLGAAVSQVVFAAFRKNFSALKSAAAVAPTGRQSPGEALQQAMGNDAYVYSAELDGPEFNSGWMQQPAAQMAASYLIKVKKLRRRNPTQRSPFPIQQQSRATASDDAAEVHISACAIFC